MNFIDAILKFIISKTDKDDPMAIMIPQNITIRSTEGERRVFYFLEKYLSADYIIWYELDAEERYPDFVIVGPEIGILILEVKDWSTKNIIGINQSEFVLSLGGKTISYPNPQKQGFNFKNIVMNKVKRSENLSDQINSLRFNHAVCFPNIDRQEYESLKDIKSSFLASEIISSDIIIFRDDIEQINNERMLTSKLNDILYYKPGCTLTKEIIDKIRVALDKNIVVKDTKCPIIKIMENRQEQIVKMYPSGNKLIRGNAGSGKSVLLSKRAQYLSERYPQSNILFLCFNIALATYFKNEIFKGYSNITIQHYHGFKNSPTNKYDFIFIDEGQDFKREWYKNIIESLSDNEMNHIIIASDGAQLIYEDDTDYDFRDLGIPFDEIIELDENYRNTAEICTLAEVFLLQDEEIYSHRCKDKYDNNYISKINRKYRHGKMPHIENVSTRLEEYRYIDSRIKELHDKGVRYSQIGILIFRNNDYDELENNLKDLPLSYLNNSKGSFSLESNSINVSVINSAKGLEFDYVFICGFLNIQKDSITEKKRVYVAMTRAIKELYIVYSKDCTSIITSMIEKAYSKFTAEIDAEITLNQINQLIEEKYYELELQDEKLKRKEIEISEREAEVEKKYQVNESNRRRLLEYEELVRQREVHVKQEEKRLQNNIEQFEKNEKKLNLISTKPRSKTNKKIIIALVIIVLFSLINNDTLLNLFRGSDGINANNYKNNKNLITFTIMCTLVKTRKSNFLVMNSFRDF